MALIVHEVALEMAKEIQPLLVQPGRHDAVMDQVRRAAASIVLNIGEAAYSQGGNRRARFHSAAGSASETRSGLKLAAAWGYLDSPRAKEVDAILDRILAMLQPVFDAPVFDAHGIRRAPVFGQPGRTGQGTPCTFGRLAVARSL